VLASLTWACLSVATGPPLFYWGARPAVITVEDLASNGPEAQVREVHAALDQGALVLRFTFDRSVESASHGPDGAPASGRLRALLYVDADGDRATGWAAGPKDARTGADWRLEIGVVAVGEDPEENVPASALVTATLATVAADGRPRLRWRSDDVGNPREVSARGEWLEVRLPRDVAVTPKARLILSLPGRALDGQLGR
jgi:hypothetical protein